MSKDYGRFTWFELVTTKTDDAKRFYTETLGWKTADGPIEGMDYTLFNVGDGSVGGMMPPPDPKLPSHWLSYVSVKDVDATAKKVVVAGGTILADAFEVPGIGRMQPVADPKGGAFCLFAAAGDDPPALEGPGTFHWNERTTGDPKALHAFYEKVLGYTADAMEMPNGTYWLLKNGDAMRGGLMASPTEDTPEGWLQYVAVNDVDRAVERARKHGARIHGELIEVPGVGRFVSLTDPVGATIAVMKPASPQA
ncbi:MAG: VOC family protein [Polyangiaceae bacterium]